MDTGIFGYNMPRLKYFGLFVIVRIFGDIPLFWMFWLLYFTPTTVERDSISIVNIILMVSFGLLHSVLARKGWKNFISNIVGLEYVRILYVIISGTGLFILLLLWQPSNYILYSTTGTLKILISLGYFIAVVGMIFTTKYIDYLDFLGLRYFKRVLQDNPQHDPEFSIRGPYAYCRHPMYSLLLVAFWLAPQMTLARFEFAILGTLYLLIGTIFEERNLQEELGDIYKKYQQHVPMWIPSFKPVKPELLGMGDRHKFS